MTRRARLPFFWKRWQSACDYLSSANAACMTSWVATILLAAVIALSGYVLLNPDSRPTLGDRSKSRTTRSTRVRFDTPGPIIASRVDNLDLDGLTIIPMRV